MANDDTPEFDPLDVAWGQTVILQELITQLIESGVLTAEHAQRIFDKALARTKEAAKQAPGAHRFVQHVHNNLRRDHSKQKDQPKNR